MQVVISGSFRKHMNEIIELKQKLEAELIIIEECEKVLNSEELMMDYDFSNSVSI